MAKKIKKKQINYIVISIVIIIAAVVGSILVITAINDSNKNNQTIAVSRKPAADKLKQKAVDALKDNKLTKAKALFNAAKKQYEYLVERSNDATIREYAQNQVIDCEAQIWLIEHQ